MKRLLLVEGLPGTGKTTTTQRLSEHFTSKDEKVITLFEGDGQMPCDFYETAGIPADEFDAFRAQHPETTDDLWGIALRTTNYVYLRLDRCSGFIADVFRKWDMGDERNRQVRVDQYISCALERLDHWVASNIDNENTAIIDSGFLQNPINELLFRGASNDEVCAFVQSVAQKLGPLNPMCVYLRRESAQAAIAFAKQAKGAAWSARVDLMLKELGCPNLFERRFELENKLLPCIPHTICQVVGCDWADVDRQIQRLF